ncbi:unnamed protein product [Notodromas monacha]|uniref:BRO1 domain-containing protein n=1 Tax=Notodromas monacha TaxID=399045 RepID=A0A7R9GHK9_9CRUS|nr:unnamed protein product [Notodromas monacha]CAG0921465.1 unnamed protein product [Notodromas monacha]
MTSTVSLLGIPLKKSGEVDLVKPFRHAIASSSIGLGAGEIDKHRESVSDFNKLRNNACSRPLDKHEAALDTLYRYHDQLSSLEKKVPPGEIQVPFKWKDAFDKGSLFGGSKSLTISSLTFEKACVLFNMAALQSQIASVQNFDHDESLKLAAKLFQQNRVKSFGFSSGVLGHLKGIVLSCVNQEPTPDLNPETLHALSALMLAQAQEVFVVKAIRDKMKDATVAKLSAQCSELYTEASRLMSAERLKQLWDREWLPIVNGKQEAYKAIAEFFQASVCEANKRVGERISRLQHAADVMKTAASKSGTFFPAFLSEYTGRIQHALEATKKENDFIFHDRVPDIRNCEPIAKVALAKSLPYQDRYGQSRDLFEDLVPLEVSQALAVADSRRMELVNSEVARLRDASQLLNGLLASMNLPAALEDPGKAGGLPPSLRDKAEKVKAEGGIESLLAMLQNLPELLQRNREVLDVTERDLNEERDSDTQLRSQFKDKWRRTESEKLTASFRQNAKRYKTIIENAMLADSTVRERFNTHERVIRMLSEKSEEELLAALPSGKGGNRDSPAANRLKTLMRKVDDLKREREELEGLFKSTDADLKSALCAMLARDGRVDEPAVSKQVLDAAYGDAVARVATNLEQQEKLVAEVQEANGDFTRDQSGDGDAREQMMKDLAAAYDAFTVLKNDLKEGTNFYNDLTQILVNFQNKVTDYCFARKTEKDELMKDLTSALASAKLDSAPNQPRHFGAAEGKKEPPPRPPPPAAGAPPAAVPQSTANAPPYSAVPYNPQMMQPHAAMPYPVQPQGMPLPYSYPQQPYPTYMPQMPSGYNPYGYMQQPPPPQGAQPQQNYAYPSYPPQQAPYHPNPHYPQQ